jgi:hypothetical protein
MTQDRGYVEGEPIPIADQSALEELKSMTAAQQVEALRRPGVIKRLTGKSLAEWFDILATDTEKAYLSNMQASRLSNGVQYNFKRKVVVPKLAVAFPELGDKVSTTPKQVKTTVATDVVSTASPIVDTSMAIARLLDERVMILAQLEAAEQRLNEVNNQLDELKTKLFEVIGI